jgi:hypothetical protein
VVKIASFAAGGKRVGALTDYLSRDGSLAVETQAGARLLGREAIAAEVARWAPLFAGRAPSRDVASLRIAGLAGSDETVTDRLAQAFQGRRFAWQRDKDDESLRVVVVLAAKDRRRLDVLAAGRRVTEARLSEAVSDDGTSISVDLVSTGHGKDGLGYRLARLVSHGPTHVSDGRTIATSAEASAVTREWTPALNARRIRDTMHLVLSAKAGTDLEAFRSTAREFLGATFAGHRYLFAIHEDRDHLHAHAVITMRDAFGDKLDPKIGDFARWRETYAAEARAHGIAVVATRRLERAAAPAYRLRDLNVIAEAERRGEPPPEKALARVAAKRSDAIHVPTRPEGLRAVAQARAAATEFAVADRLAVADTAATFLATLKSIWEAPSAQETDIMATRPLDEMQADLKSMNATATRIALLLPAASRPQFHALANPILQQAAAVVDQVAATSSISTAVAAATTLARQEEREARDARQVADSARRAAEPLRRNEGPGAGERLEAGALARAAERNAQRERQEALAAADLVRRVESAPGDDSSKSGSVESDAARRLQAQQARLVRQKDEAAKRERDRGVEDEL